MMAASFSEGERSSKSVTSDLLSAVVVERRLERTLLKLAGTMGIVTLVHDDVGKMAEGWIEDGDGGRFISFLREELSGEKLSSENETRPLPTMLIQDTRYLLGLTLYARCMSLSCRF